jgi:hypothetical protein
MTGGFTPAIVINGARIDGVSMFLKRTEAIDAGLGVRSYPGQARKL